MYVGEIHPEGALNPERHLYEELIYILQGMGSTEVWSRAKAQKIHFEWQAGSLFAIPLNAWHRLVNGSWEPVVYLAVTSAPLIMDLLHDPDFIFGCDYMFHQRFDGRPDYFVMGSLREERVRFTVWESNFIADVRRDYAAELNQQGISLQMASVNYRGL